jgi:multidrug efflux pump subunit AcrB
VNDEYSDVTFALYALKAKGEPHRALVRDAEVLRQRLLHVPGVKKVNIIGEQAERIFVEFSSDRLATWACPRETLRRAQQSGTS